MTQLPLTLAVSWMCSIDTRTYLVIWMTMRHLHRHWPSHEFAQRIPESIGNLNDYEAAAINAGCLTEVISKHWNVPGESGKLPVADSPQVTITTKLGALFIQRPYRMGHHLWAAQSITASWYYNQDRLAQKANTGQIKVGDQVMIKWEWITPRTAIWDHHFTITQVRAR